MTFFTHIVSAILFYSFAFLFALALVVWMEKYQNRKP